MQGALNVIEVPDLVELVGILASDHDCNAARSLESGEDVCRIVRPGGGRKDGGSGEELYGQECH